ncbi:ABC transporter substrate-binding protein [Actinomadura madurae]|uniref:ABC transporter substrate-binding protein n=1 Tax=Actinomadura madurae TaxID=1993 RepID=UPI002025DE17|nr:extracellular solute-binding protein [Actinomadura madurae]MCP9949816.1 extracellular solute-binding protein [Actinomadura madurae]MCP9966567.1 extracellular solute-binding protein [Actinomadura madurae]MCQ0009415.1 extracellular solute-binding protein [Actinomadura madurae]MCQ0015241.1 extracellular solute-binding protein [Actinomadura madurae]URM95392.1 extracellular solute-binding protein [Actinomadura madurae]
MTSSIRTAPLSRRGFLGLTGGVAALGALAACGGTSGSGGGTLRLVGVADQQKPLDLLLKEYTAAKFSTSYAPTDQVQTSVRTQLGAGNAPDVHVVFPGNGSAMSMAQIAQTGLLADLSDQAWTKRIPAGLMPAFQLDGKTFLYSAGSSVIGAVYNKKAFTKAGVEPPTTWQGFLDVCEKLKKKGTVPIALGAQTPWVTQLITYALVPSTVYAKNPKFDEQMQAGQASFANSGWADALDMYLELQKRGYFNDNPNGTTFEQQTSMVATGKAAMAIQVSAVLPDFRKAAASPDDLAMFPVPGADDANRVWIPAGVVVGLGVSARSKNKNAAKAFIEFLGEQKNMNRWAEAVACVPLSRDSGSKIDPVLEPFLPFIDGNKAVPFMDQAWPNAEVQPAHFAAVQELLGGKTTVAKALATLDETYRKK